MPATDPAPGAAPARAAADLPTPGQAQAQATPAARHWPPRLPGPADLPLVQRLGPLLRRTRRSIRARLIASLMLGLAAVAVSVGMVTYRNVLHEAEQLFDYQLRQMALGLRDQGEISPDEAAALNDEDLDFVIQIWHLDGRIVYASRRHRALPGRAVLGYADVDVAGGERWRSFAVAAAGRVIQVAQPLRIRRALAAESAWRAVWPLLAGAPLLAAALWWLVSRALAPLQRTAAQIAARDAASLEPLPLRHLPDEVAPLVQALNGLLGRLDQALDAQRAFIADAAHELRSPLTALKLQAQLLQRVPAGPDRDAVHAQLVAGVDRAGRLVAQLLTLARSEPGGAQAAQASCVDLASLSAQVLADAQPLACARAQQLSGPADAGGLSMAVRGDAAGLGALVRNLVDNALRYTPDGGHVQLDLAAVADDRGRPGWRLRVDDDGPGIAPSERERVFERFVRGAAGNGQTGSGLGLAIVRRVAETLGGTVTLGDAPSGGLRAEVWLPAAD
ncbi:MAG: hypothetical protein RL223_2125 [Pseudomonadota bacterium]